jgi:O-antigen/teichoic acid export membrane protein
VAAYAAPAVTAVIGITYLYNIDVILARHYLSSREAGIYAAGAVLARVAYFLGLTITGVMFPEVAGRHARDEAHYHVVELSLAFLAAAGVCLIAAYALLPGLVLLPYGAQFDPVKPYLGPFAAALTLLALSNLLVNYFLSVNSRRFVPPLLAAALLETGLMTVFHHDLGQLLLVLLGVNLGLALVLGALYTAERV